MWCTLRFHCAGATWWCTVGLPQFYFSRHLPLNGIQIAIRLVSIPARFSIAIVRRFPAVFLCALFASFLISAPVIWSHSLRNAYLLTLHRHLAALIPPLFVFTGDSLTANIDWGWALARNPLAAVNLAEDGATINQVALQVSKADSYHGEYLVVTAGTNDIVGENRSLPQVLSDFESLIERVPKGMKVVVTLIPYTSFQKHRDAIRSANLGIRSLISNHDGIVVDINPLVSIDGILEARYTTDGVHFNAGRL